MISRGGMETFRKVQADLRATLDRCPWPDRSILEAEDLKFIRENLSPGGTADLLALCFMLHFLKEDEKDGLLDQ